MKTSNMVFLMAKNVIIVILVVLLLAAGWYGLREREKFHATASSLAVAQSAKSTPPRIPTLTKGMKLSESPISKFAYKIAPGDLSDDAKKALTGFDVTAKNQSDGSILVSLTPKDSDDINQQYTVKKGYELYFVEMTPADDSGDKDKNLRDDYGIIVDSQGVIQ